MAILPINSFARGFEPDPGSFWTDGSALPGGVGAGAVVGFVEGYEEPDQEGNRAIREREGTLGCGQRGKGRGRREKERTGRDSDRSDGLEVRGE